MQSKYIIFYNLNVLFLMFLLILLPVLPVFAIGEFITSYYIFNKLNLYNNNLYIV